MPRSHCLLDSPDSFQMYEQNLVTLTEVLRAQSSMTVAKVVLSFEIPAQPVNAMRMAVTLNSSVRNPV
jgi:hypothetical protein